MDITFHGAVRTVTGSQHLVEVNGLKILLDCGLFQGSRKESYRRNQELPYTAAEVDLLVLSHAHIDHSGNIPNLVKSGFTGDIVCTYATRDLCAIMLRDSAKIQQYDVAYVNKKRERQGLPPIEPIYSIEDAVESLKYFIGIGYERPYRLAPGISLTFYDAGHILGSASILLELEEGGNRKRILFSGDLGYDGRAILPDPATPPHADIVVMETTYGDRLHKKLEPSIDELYHAINTTIDRNGNVLIPSFALERTQELLYYLREGIEQEKLPRNLPVFLDSPMAISATQIFRRHHECFDEETWSVISTGADPFELPGLEMVRDTAESMALKHIHGAVIIAGSGMCTGGRIRHHLRHNLWRTESSVIFVGYAASGTLARKIIDGAEEVRVFQEKIEVNAEIYTIGGFSAHADQQELLKWHAQTGTPERTFLIHGEIEAMQTLAGHLTSSTVEMPSLHESFELL